MDKEKIAIAQARIDELSYETECLNCHTDGLMSLYGDQVENSIEIKTLCCDLAIKIIN